MVSKKLRAPWVPAYIVPPDQSAPLEEWQCHRADLDALQAKLLVSHPDLDWLDGLRSFKAGADAAIRRKQFTSPQKKTAPVLGGKLGPTEVYTVKEDRYPTNPQTQESS